MWRGFRYWRYGKMHPIFRFCFFPTCRDRYWRGWMHGIMCLVCLCCGIVAYTEERTLVSLSNMCAFGWNAITCLANFMIHSEWKEITQHEQTKHLDTTLCT